MEQKPLVSDEQINSGRDLYKKLILVAHNEIVAEEAAEGHTQGCVAIRHIYEASRKMDRELIERLGKWMDAYGNHAGKCRVHRITGADCDCEFADLLSEVAALNQTDKS